MRQVTINLSLVLEASKWVWTSTCQAVFFGGHAAFEQPYRIASQVRYRL